MNSKRTRGNYGTVPQNGCTSNSAPSSTPHINIDLRSAGSAVNNNNSHDSDSDDNISINIDLNAQFLDDLNCSLITQIREQSATGRNADNEGPYRSQLQQIARSRRRPIMRTKSESDFQMLMDDDIHEMRVKLLRGHNNRHHHTSTFNLKTVTKFTRRQKSALASIALVDFTSFCAMSILAPFFPNEASKKGMPPWVSGFVFSVYALTVFIASPFMGKAVSLVGPKFLLTIGVFLGGCCNILFGLLDRVESLEMFTAYCFIVRIFEAVGAAAFATSSYTFVAKIFPDNIGAVLGVLETFVGLGMSFGPAIGGFLFDLGGYGLPFYSLGALMILTIPLNLFLLPSNDDDDMDPEPSESMWKLARVSPIFILSLVIIVASNTWSFLDPTLEPHLREFNFSAKELALFFLIASVLYAISSPCWGVLADRMNRTWIMMVVGLSVSSVGLLLLGPSPFIPLENSVWINVLALVILGASISMTLLPTFEAMLDIAIERGYGDETSTYGLIGGLWSSMYSFGEVTGPSLGAFLMDHLGFPICSTVMAGICLVTAFVVFFHFQTSYDSEDPKSDSASRQSATDKMRSSDIYDSGISEKSGSSSVSAKGEKLGSGYSSNRHEKLRLLDPEKQPITSGPSNERLRNVAKDVLSNLSNSPSTSTSSLENSAELDSSYPGVLRTLGITATGAIEI